MRWIIGMVSVVFGAVVFAWLPNPAMELIPDQISNFIPESYVAYALVVMVWLGLAWLAAKIGPGTEDIGPRIPQCGCGCKPCTKCAKSVRRCGCGCKPCAECKCGTHTIKPVFQGMWLMWVILLFCFEFIHQTDTAWPGLIMGFLVIEIYTAFIDKCLGDTFSEQVWSFMHSEVARAGMALGIIFLLIVRIIELGEARQTEILGGLDLGRVVLAAGFGVWVIYHFIDREVKRRQACK